MERDLRLRLGLLCGLSGQLCRREDSSREGQTVGAGGEQPEENRGEGGWQKSQEKDEEKSGVEQDYEIYLP